MIGKMAGSDLEAVALPGICREAVSETVPLSAAVRLYHFAGTQHSAGGLPLTDPGFDKRSWLSVTAIVAHDKGGSPPDTLEHFAALYEGEAPASAEECARHADHHRHCAVCEQACRVCIQACSALLNAEALEELQRLGGA